MSLLHTPMQQALIYLAGKLIEERIDFSITPRENGQWNVGTNSEAGAKRINILMREWKRNNDVPGVVA